MTDEQAGGDDIRNWPGAVRVRRKPVTLSVEFASEPGTLDTREGEVRYDAGDALLTGVEGERWPIPADVFPRLYAPAEGTEPGEPGLYVRKPEEMTAVQLSEPRTVELGEGRGTLQAQPGDWLLQGHDGEQRVVSEVALRETYQFFVD